MKIALITDTWLPEVNGVVVTLRHLTAELSALGHEIQLLTPDTFSTIQCPGFNTVRLALFPQRGVTRILDEWQPATIHIATEGPLGLAARHYCLKRRLSFTTSYHTRFPEYLRTRAPVPLKLSYAWLRRFHQPAARVLVSTSTLVRHLASHGFCNLTVWGKGVDTELFRPHDKNRISDPRPVWMYAGRVAAEKNLEAYLSLDLPGTKYVVGDGPELVSLRKRYPQARYTGFLLGQDLARQLATADVFVFPSLTDTFGLVLLEALACGVPVAAYPVMGPADVVNQGVTGYCHGDLQQAALACLSLNPEHCRAQALRQGWHQVAAQFVAHMVPARPVADRLAG
ncbi:MAG: glycosyltransferase family 1 protein [Gammaproteobacteria bacterium]